jgi:4'-phosphopantetheinyl transferase EntD
MAHDDRIAVAAVGLRRDLGSVGIDIEPAAPLPPDMLELIATAPERRAIALCISLTKVLERECKCKAKDSCAQWGLLGITPQSRSRTSVLCL